MSGYLGSLTERASKAAGDALARGATALTAHLLGLVGSFDSCFLTDRECAGRIMQHNGRNPHPRSVARVRRFARDAGWLDCVRVMPGHRPPGARFTSTGGTTSKRVNFAGLGSRDPLTRGEKRKLRRRQASVDATVQAMQTEPEERSQPVTPPRDRPVHTTQPPNGPELYATKPMDPLSAILAEATANMQAKWQRDEDRQDLRMMRSAVEQAKKRPKPPD